MIKGTHGRDELLEMCAKVPDFERVVAIEWANVCGMMLNK